MSVQIFDKVTLYVNDDQLHYLAMFFYGQQKACEFAHDEKGERYNRQNVNNCIGWMTKEGEAFYYECINALDWDNMRQGKTKENIISALNYMEQESLKPGAILKGGQS